MSSFGMLPISDVCGVPGLRVSMLSMTYGRVLAASSESCASTYL